MRTLRRHEDEIAISSVVWHELRFGVVVFEMLAGEPPFTGSTPMAIIAKHLQEPLPCLRRHRRNLPASVQRLLERPKVR